MTALISDTRYCNGCDQDVPAQDIFHSILAQGVPHHFCKGCKEAGKVERFKRNIPIHYSVSDVDFLRRMKLTIE